MKKELALKLIQETLPMLSDDENKAAAIFRELQFLSNYKYNSYEMYNPGRLFLESLYLWLHQFKPEERMGALNFVREKLIYISRQEFQQLAVILYHDVIRREQIRVTSEITKTPSHKIRLLVDSPCFKQVSRSSLFVGMSDGARIDYIRRQNLKIGNEQVLPYYEVSVQKKEDLKKELRKELDDPSALFRCLFLVDDFCGSGRTLLREVVSTELEQPAESPTIPILWQSRFRFIKDDNKLELNYQEIFSSEEQQALFKMGTDQNYIDAVNRLLVKCFNHDTFLKGSLVKAADSLRNLLDVNCSVFFCPLLATEAALDRLKPLIPKLTGCFADTRILPGAVLKNDVRILSTNDPIGVLCETYYSDDMADQHTGCVKFGFDNGGLPLVLHHNTPNNSIFLLWTRKHSGFTPLFVRYERHGREVA